MNIADDKKRVQVTLTLNEYEKLTNLAEKERRSISATIAKLAMERLEQSEQDGK